MTELFGKENNDIMKNLILPYIEFKDLTVLARVSCNMYLVYLQYFKERKGQINQYIRDIKHDFGNENLEDPVVHFLTVFKPELMQKHFAYVGDRLYAFRDTDYAYQVFQHVFDLWIAGTPLLDKLPEFDYDAQISKIAYYKNLFCTYTRKQKPNYYKDIYTYYLKTSIPCNNELSISKSYINLDYLYFNKNFEALTFKDCKVFGNVNPNNIKFDDYEWYDIKLINCKIENPDFINHFKGASKIILGHKPINFNHYIDFTFVDFEEFKNLEDLIIDYTYLNIDSFLNLKYLRLDYCHLNRVNWNSIANITTVELYECDIAEVDIQLTIDAKLKYLVLINNNITNLNLGGHGEILYLYLDHNLLRYLDLSNIHIFDFSCKNNSLHEIKMNNLYEMESVCLSYNKLKSVPSLNSRNVKLSHNNLTKYTVHSNTYKLIIENNELTNLDGEYDYLHYLDASNNNLKYVSLSGAARLSDLNLSYNQITQIDLPPRVSSVNLFKNKIYKICIYNIVSYVKK